MSVLNELILGEVGFKQLWKRILKENKKITDYSLDNLQVLKITGNVEFNTPKAKDNKFYFYISGSGESGGSIYSNVFSGSTQTDPASRLTVQRGGNGGEIIYKELFIQKDSIISVSSGIGGIPVLDEYGDYTIPTKGTDTIVYINKNTNNEEIFTARSGLGAGGGNGFDYTLKNNSDTFFTELPNSDFPIIGEYCGSGGAYYNSLNAGRYGGSGGIGSCFYYENSYTIGDAGEKGGKGGLLNLKGEDGTFSLEGNTLLEGKICPIIFDGTGGIGGTYSGGGGGGYKGKGGNGGTAELTSSSVYFERCVGGGGGGGYHSRGGNGDHGCGGGGGYCGDGGNAFNQASGGGGGLFANGSDGYAEYTGDTSYPITGYSGGGAGITPGNGVNGGDGGCYIIYFRED